MKKSLFRSTVITAVVFFAIFAAPLQAFSSSDQAHAAAHGSNLLLLYLVVLLLSAKIGGIVEKLGQPAVLGELAAGVFLSAFAFFGLHFLEDVRISPTMAFLSELGAILLLFKIGLESNIAKLSKVGVSAFVVALIGVILPFVGGTYLLGPLLFPQASSVAHLFIGASMVATSVGITACVFNDLKSMSYRPCQTVLGAAVIDDVLGLFVLAIVSAIATGGQVDAQFIAMLSAKALGFLIGAIALGNLLATNLSRLFAIISTNTGMKVALALAFALSYAYLASLAGLAPIIGAFCAGLILDAVHFKSFAQPSMIKDLLHIRTADQAEKQRIQKIIDKHSHTHVEDLVDTIGYLLVPIFFVFTGLQIEFATLLNPTLYGFALLIAILAIVTKIAAGFFAQGTLREKMLVGVSMVPRGEVGLIFASIGKSTGALSDELFSILILVIIITTFIAPPLIKHFTNAFLNEQKQLSTPGLKAA